MITVPDGAGDEPLQILASLSRALMRNEFRLTLLDGKDAQVIVDTIHAAGAGGVGRGSGVTSADQGHCGIR